MAYLATQVRQHPKTINRSFAARIKSDPVTFIAENTRVVTLEIQNSLIGRKYNGEDLPLQESNGDYGFSGEGVLLSSIVDIYDATTGLKIAASTLTGDVEVYGRLAFSGSFGLSLFYLDAAGVEASYTHSGDIAFEFDYVHRFEDLPLDFATSISSKNISQDIPGSGGDSLVREVFTITERNKVPALTNKPKAGSVTINYTGQTLSEINGDFSIVETTDLVDPLIKYYVVGKKWDSATMNAGKWRDLIVGYTLEAGDKITVTYTKE